MSVGDGTSGEWAKFSITGPALDENAEFCAPGVPWIAGCGRMWVRESRLK